MCLLQCLHCTDEAHIGRNRGSPVCSWNCWCFSWSWKKSNKVFDHHGVYVRRKVNFIYVLGFVVLRDVVKVLPVSSSSFARKDDREEPSTKSLGGMTRPKDEMGSQIVPSESNIFHPILCYLSRNNNSQAQFRRFSALTAQEPEFPVIFGPKWDPLTSAWRQLRETRWTSDGRLSSPETNLKVGLLPLFFMQLLFSHMFLSFMVRTSPLSLHIHGDGLSRVRIWLSIKALRFSEKADK